MADFKRAAASRADRRRERSRREARSTVATILYAMGYCLLIGMALHVLGFVVFLVLS